MPCLISVCNILAFADPRESIPWDCDRFHEDQVLSAIQNKKYISIPFDEGDAEQHIQRIACLVAVGWDDPIEIDVGCPTLGYHIGWPILDGNHRLYAAILRDDVSILSCVSGDLDYAASIFNITLKELVEK